ncbi:hypothetical protein [Chamaesiphon minutus]|uniref:Lipoprotein n=1 Tax=Chamaesiphon minutus (strain ATCC 27169 / PCC 6605) TaxID=1173020 RepID=K9UPZ6_CHAP6|nr:hypothetical protein [Chamaesiphon minutus]AFY96880.1 hypothetical protein Cha6605_6040 [Chamaesiphon minutus PCC 6605]
MKPLTSGIIVLASSGLLLLGACSKEAKNSDSANPNATTPSAETASPVTTTPPATTTAKTQSSEGGKSNGGQVVESGKYHLEFVPEKGTSETHLDLYLQKGDNHEAVANAKVTADVQLPDGKLKTVPLSYDASGKHYAAVLKEKVTGQYQVKITATIGSEKADGRFNFVR